MFRCFYLHLKCFHFFFISAQYHRLPNISVPLPQFKGNYGSVKLEAVCSAFNYSNIKDKVIWKSAEPKTFEFLNTPYGYVLYQTVIPSEARDPALLHISDFRDRAIVYLDEVSFCFRISRKSKTVLIYMNILESRRNSRSSAQYLQYTFTNVSRTNSEFVGRESRSYQLRKLYGRQKSESLTVELDYM